MSHVYQKGRVKAGPAVPTDLSEELRSLVAECNGHLTTDNLSAVIDEGEFADTSLGQVVDDGSTTPTDYDLKSLGLGWTVIETVTLTTADATVEVIAGIAYDQKTGSTGRVRALLLADGEVIDEDEGHSIIYKRHAFFNVAWPVTAGLHTFAVALSADAIVEVTVENVNLIVLEERR